MLLVAATVVVAAVMTFPRTDAAGAPAHGRTLFGMNAPSLGALDAATSAVGVRPAIVGTFADWAHTPDFPRPLAEGINDRGAVPLISWEPWDSWTGGAEQPAYALDRIATGTHDALIDRWARQVADYGRPVMLRFAAEMNGDWLPWSTGVNGNGRGDYVAAWRHVRERFARAGAGNAIWVWNPNAAYEGSTPLRALYPGARQVDWVAVDGYNWGAARTWGWQSYEDVFGPTVRALRRLAPRKRLMIAETGCAPGRRKPAWIRRTLRAARGDRVDAVVWFEFAKEADWRLSESQATATAARDALGGWGRGGDLDAVERAVRAAR